MNLAQTIISLTPAQRKSYIDEKSSSIEIPNNLSEELHKSYQYSRIVNEFIIPYFDLRAEKLIQTDIQNRITQSCERLSAVLIEALQEDNLYNLDDFIEVSEGNNPSNLFELLGYYEASFLQKKERKISEKIGHYWEIIAACSSNAIAVEEEFDIKMKEVDLIINWDDIYYCQLKTKGDTLTGTQVPRTLSTLRIYGKSIFAAAIHTNNFPFGESRANKNNIIRLRGNEFWNILGINYEQLLQGVSRSLNEILKTN